MLSLSNDEEKKQQLANKMISEVNVQNKNEHGGCTCASVQVESAKSGLFCDKCENQQQMLRGNGKENQTGFNVGKQMEEDEAIDSGFISGLNPSSNLEFEEEITGDIDFKEKSQKSVPEARSVQQKPQKGQGKSKVQDTKSYLDSGCIESEEEAFEEIGDTDIRHSASATSGVNESEVKKRQFEGVVDEMRLKNDVDNNLSARFGALNIQNNSSGINNLNSTQGRSNSSNTTTTQSSLLLQQNARQKPRITGWEEFYQQNSDGDTPLHLACLAGAEDVVIAVLRLAIHPCLYNIQNDDAQTPLHMAALCAHSKILRLLLIMGADPSIRDRHGNTALHLVVDAGDEQSVRALLTPISATEIQETLLICTPKFNHKKLLHNLKESRTDLEIRNYNGEKCVHLAAQEGHINILRMLVQYGADINAREGKSGRTPLHIAIESCNEGLLNFMLEECHDNLNLETETYAGLTAYQFACLLDREKLISILEKSGAEILTPPVSDYEYSDGEDLEDSKIFGDSNYFAGYIEGKVLRVA